MPYGILRLLQRIDDAVRPFEKALALPRQLEHTGSPVKQTDPQPILEPLDQLADSRRIAVKAARGCREAGFLSHPEEDVKLSNTVVHWAVLVWSGLQAMIAPIRQIAGISRAPASVARSRN